MYNGFSAQTRGHATQSASTDGWFFGHVLDGAGGSSPLSPWDAAAVRKARDGRGAWVHLDFRAPQAQGFIAACARARGKDHQIQRQTHVSSLMVADPRKAQPRCEVAYAARGMLLSLEVNFGKRVAADDQQKSIVPFRMWLGRGILITARGRPPDEGQMRLPALSRALDIGRGPANCGALASAVISEITSITAEYGAAGLTQCPHSPLHACTLLTVPCALCVVCNMMCMVQVGGGARGRDL